MSGKSVLDLMQKIAVVMLVCCIGLTEPAMADSVSFSANGVSLKASVESLKARKFSQVLQQRYDYSCGSASLATLLKFHYQHDVDAVDIFTNMYASGDQKIINQWGFSLLDMKNYLRRQGYESEAIRVSLDQFLQLVSVPAIVMIQVDGYKHFVVMKGVRDGYVLLGDPARGLRRLPVSEFDTISSGMFFIITSHASNGRESFNRDSDWLQLVRAPLADAVTRPDLNQFNLSLPLQIDFF